METTEKPADTNRDEMIMQQQRLIEKEVWPLLFIYFFTIYKFIFFM